MGSCFGLPACVQYDHSASITRRKNAEVSPEQRAEMLNPSYELEEDPYARKQDKAKS